jgi:hypothetical protein
MTKVKKKRKAREWWAVLGMTPTLWPTRYVARRHKVLYGYRPHVQIIHVREVLKPKRKR